MGLGLSIVNELHSRVTRLLDDRSYETDPGDRFIVLCLVMESLDDDPVLRAKLIEYLSGEERGQEVQNVLKAKTNITKRKMYP